MSEYEVIELVLDLEKTGVEYGQYIMAGLFAFVVTIFVLGQKMTKLMVVLLSVVYSAYVMLLIAGVVGAYSRASALAVALEGRELASQNAFSDLAAGYAYSGWALCAFWLIAYAISIVFVVLVRRQKFVEPTT